MFCCQFPVPIKGAFWVAELGSRAVARNLSVWISAVSSLYPEGGRGRETAEIQTRNLQAYA